MSDHFVKLALKGLIHYDEVVRPDILQVLICSFASSHEENDRFIVMFPDSRIAQNYLQQTKEKCNIHFVVALVQ